MNIDDLRGRAWFAAITALVKLARNECRDLIHDACTQFIHPSVQSQQRLGTTHDSQVCLDHVSPRAMEERGNANHNFVHVCWYEQSYQRANNRRKRPSPERQRAPHLFWSIPAHHGSHQPIRAPASANGTQLSQPWIWDIVMLSFGPFHHMECTV